jgi:hypothetical protein
MEEQGKITSGEILDNGTAEGLKEFLTEHLGEQAVAETKVESTPPTDENKGDEAVEKETAPNEQPQTTEAQTTEVNADNASTDEGSEDSKNSLFDLLSDNTQTQSTPSEEGDGSNKQVEIPEEIQQRLSEYEALKSQLEAINENPLMKALALAKDANEVRQIAKEIAGEDVSKLSIQELISREAKSMGIDGEELNDVIEEELASYNSLGTLAKRKFENELRSKYDKAGESALLKQLEEQYKAQQRIDPEEEKIAFEKAVKQDETLLAQEAQKWVGQEFNGVKIDENFQKELVEAYYDDKYQYFDQNGNFKTSQFARLVFWDKYGMKLLQAAKENAKAEVIKSRSNPSKDGMIAGQTPQTDDRPEGQKLLEAFENGQIDWNKF